jgi:hypothetical protein
LAAIPLATVPITPMAFVKFNFKFANPTKSYEVHKTRIRQFHLLYGEARGMSSEFRGSYTEKIFSACKRRKFR